MKILLVFAMFTLTVCIVYSQNYYWVGGSGNWSDYTNHWATTSGGSTFQTQVPQSGDNVIFDSNSFTAAGQTVTIDIQSAYCRNITWTGVTNKPALTGSGSNTLKVYGSLTLVKDMIFSFGGGLSFESINTGKYNLNGKSAFYFRYNI